MTPLSVVQPVAGERAGEAGVVHSVQTDEAGNVIAVAVQLDRDPRGVLTTFAPEELRVLLAH